MINYSVGMRVQIKVPSPSFGDSLHANYMYDKFKPFHDCYGTITYVYRNAFGIRDVNVMLYSDTTTTVLTHIPCECIVLANDESSNELLCCMRSKTSVFDDCIDSLAYSYRHLQSYRVLNKYEPVRIIYHDPATIVFWSDGSKTVVKRSSKEKFNKYTAFCAALAKKIYGNNSRVNKIVNSGEDSLQKTGKKKEKKEKNK